MNKINRKVDGYVRKNKRWQEALQALRAIVLDSPLAEEVKWRVPCYTFQNRNIIILGAFKEYCAISFVKGALLKDDRNVLEMPGPNTQSARMIRFRNVREIVELEPVLKAYIAQSIKVEQAGIKVIFKKPAEFVVPGEFQKKLDEWPDLKAAFKSLTPGRQRAYLLYFSAAKQSKTRAARVEKWTRQILDGKGMED